MKISLWKASVRERSSFAERERCVYNKVKRDCETDFETIVRDLSVDLD